jgi:hypothetical protein
VSQKLWIRLSNRSTYDFRISSFVLQITLRRDARRGRESALRNGNASRCRPTRANDGHSSLRERFGIQTRNAATASRLIRDAMDADLLVLTDEGAAKSARHYLP